ASVDWQPGLSSPGLAQGAPRANQGRPRTRSQPMPMSPAAAATRCCIDKPLNYTSPLRQLENKQTRTKASSCLPILLVGVIEHAKEDSASDQIDRPNRTSQSNTLPRSVNRDNLERN